MIVTDKLRRNAIKVIILQMQNEQLDDETNKRYESLERCVNNLVELLHVPDVIECSCCKKPIISGMCAECITDAFNEKK